MQEVSADSIPMSNLPKLVLDPLPTKEKLYELQKENIMLKMRLVKIMVMLENVAKAMDKAKDGIMAQLTDVSLELPEK
jgi:hypothetical protein